MVCDSVFWLSREGGRITRSSSHFDAIMGKSMAGAELSLSITDDDCKRFLNGAEAPGSRAVALFPTSLKLSSLEVARVELFVVDRRCSSPDESSTKKHRGD